MGPCPQEQDRGKSLRLTSDAFGLVKKDFVVKVLSTRRKPSLLAFPPSLGELQEGSSQKQPSAVGTRGSAEDFSGRWPCPILVPVAASLSQLPREARAWSGCTSRVWIRFKGSRASKPCAHEAH